MQITVDQFKSLFKDNKKPEETTAAVNSVLSDERFDSKEKVAMFLAQCGHESAGFSVLSENLNYSSDALMKLFGKYFDSKEQANLYHRNPEKIASRIYANRMGNGSEESKEGWKYRGRGPIQITGKSNYKKASLFLYKDERLVSDPEPVSSLDVGLKCAFWFWVENSLFSLSSDIVKATKKINGGTIGLEHRTSLYTEALKLL